MLEIQKNELKLDSVEMGETSSQEIPHAIGTSKSTPEENKMGKRSRCS